MAKKKAATMKAQVFYEPLKMAVEDAPMPQIADDEVLVRVKACGICGSDIAYYFGMSSLETPRQSARAMRTDSEHRNPSSA